MRSRDFTSYSNMAMNNMAMNNIVQPTSVIARIPQLVVEYHVYRAPVKCLSSIFVRSRAQLLNHLGCKRLQSAINSLFPLAYFARYRDRVALWLQVSGLEEQLATRRVVERQSGILIEKHGLGYQESSRKISMLALHNRKSMREVAEAILLAEELSERAPRNESRGSPLIMEFRSLLPS